MTKFYNLSETEKRSILEEASKRLDMPIFNVEKDWWVTQTLTLVFNMDIGKHLVFKGGTSLSKSWGIIKRFSEDVDLAVNRGFLGDFEGELKKKKITKLRKASSAHIINEFAPDLQEEFNKRGMNDVKINVIETTESDQDPKLVEIQYSPVVAYANYIKPRVLLEIGCRSLIEPKTEKAITSLIDETFPDTEFAQQPVLIPSVNPERTFLEKIFLLHEEFQKPEPRSERMSRHLYDLYKLCQVPECKAALSNKDLYNTIVNHRIQFTKMKEVDYTKHKPEFIDFLPNEKVLDAYRKDYNEMQENMINEEGPSFDDLMKELEQLKVEVNSVKH
jgi:hypothetical protein